MMSGITKKVLAFTICLAMLTGSIPANAEGTVSGSSIPTVAAESIGLETGTPTTQENTGQVADSSDTTTIEDGQTPTAPAPSTDGVGSGGANGSVSGNVGDEADNGTTVSGNEGTTETVSGNVPDTVSDNSLSDNSLSDNSLSDNS